METTLPLAPGWESVQWKQVSPEKFFCLHEKIYVSDTKYAVLHENDAMSCVQNFATSIGWVGALGLFVGFLVFPANMEDLRFDVLLVSLLILVLSVVFKLTLFTVNKYCVRNCDKESTIPCKMC